MKKIILNSIVFIYLAFNVLLLPFSLQAASSATSVIFYPVGNNSIEVRDIAPDDATYHIELQSAMGRKLKIGKTAIFTSSDFEGISKGKDFLKIHFKKTVWTRARETTANYLDKRIAIVINKKLFLAPVVGAPFWKFLPFYIPDEKIYSQNNYFAGFSEGTIPAYIDDKDINVGFLESLVAKKPGDIEAISELANLYISDKRCNKTAAALTPKNCDKAIPLFKKLILQQPKEEYHYTNLYQCFMAKKSYSNAISTMEGALPNLMASEKWRVFVKIGQAHQKNGSDKKALEAFNTAHILLENTPMLPYDVYDIDAAKYIMSNRIAPELIDQINTIEELEAFLKKDSFARIEALISQVKK